MQELLPDIQRWQAEGKRVALATVVSAYGSAPRKVGAKMAISDDGQFSGSVSGGCVENDVVEHAQQVLGEDAPRLVSYGITDDMAFNVGLACGGQIEVFIQSFSRQLPLDEPIAWAFVDRAEHIGASLLVRESGQFSGSLGRGASMDEQVAREAADLLRRGHTGHVKLDGGAGETIEVFVDTYPAKPTVYIFGGVHTGVALATFARRLDFRVIVVDARGRWATPERFPDADELHVMRADDYLAANPLGSNAFVAVLSHDPKLDDPALFGALQSPARYVGAIGSGKTQRARRERLLKAGLTEAQVARLHGPIGLDIAAQTPEEIALAILAEMVREKNQRPTPEVPAPLPDASTSRPKPEASLAPAGA